MQIQVNDDKIRFSLEWHERLWSFHLSPTLTIPTAHIADISTEIPSLPWYTLRAPGTAIPGLFAAGTFYTSQGREFWYVTRGTGYLILTLTEEYYRRIVFSTDNSQTWAQRIRVACSHVRNS